MHSNAISPRSPEKLALEFWLLLCFIPQFGRFCSRAGKGNRCINTISATGLQLAGHSCAHTTRQMVLRKISTSLQRYFHKYTKIFPQKWTKIFPKKWKDVYNDEGDALLRAMLAQFFLLLCFQFRAVYLSNPCFLICSRSLIYSFCCKANKCLCKWANTRKDGNRKLINIRVHDLT